MKEPRVRAIFERELSQMDWSSGFSKQQLVDHFWMAPTIREMLEAQLPDTTFRSAQAVMQGISQDAWQTVEQTIEHGTPESHYLQGLVAKFDDRGETSGWGRITEQQQRTDLPPSEQA